jgi:hypothetical protein
MPLPALHHALREREREREAIAQTQDLEHKIGYQNHEKT